MTPTPAERRKPAHTGLIAGALFLAGSVVSAAELGDINGDGRVSFADAHRFDQWIVTGDPAFAPAPGSDRFEGVFDCTNLTFGDNPDLVGAYMPYLLYHESLRRAAPSPLPHIVEVWPGEIREPADPPPVDPRVALEVLSVVHRETSERVEIGVLLTSSVPIVAIGLIFQADGLDLRPDRTEPDREDGLRTTTTFYLVSGGLLAYRSRFRTHRSYAFEAGEHVLSFPAEIPRGTPAGTYAVGLIEGTEVVSTGGVVMRPNLRGGSLEIREEITGGHDLPFPPLDFVDLEAQRVGGRSELRVTGAAGFPGDEVNLRVELRTEVPVNSFRFYLGFDGNALDVKEVIPLYGEPETGQVAAANFATRITSHRQPPFQGRGSVSLEYGSAGVTTRPRPYEAWNGQYSLKYLVPLDEWIDLFEIRAFILEDARGLGTTPIDLLSVPGQPVRFDPYAETTGFASCTALPDIWSYEPLVFTAGAITILGGGDPPPPPPPPIDPAAAQIRFWLGDAKGIPGETVRIPVRFEAAEELWMLRLALEYDPDQLELVAFEVNGVDADGLPESASLTPDEPYHTSMICEGEAFERICRGGLPQRAVLRGEGAGDVIPEGVVLVDIISSLLYLGRGRGKIAWEASELHEIGWLVFRVRDTAPPGTAEVSGASVEWTEQGTVVPGRSVTSGFPLVDEPPGRGAAVPAIHVESGSVVIVREIHEFVRGDANRDGRIDLSDSVRVLDSLFQGGDDLTCEDAADVNDDGRVDLADAVYGLGFLFAGGPAPPLPHPAAGADPSQDALRCQEE